MADHDPAYINTLASQLCTRHTALLDSAETELALLRARIALVATFIHNPTYDHTARQALAQTLGLPEPGHP
ncbi:hypothetical protein [Streptomyces pilosus]|uniref:hypothetical protein n=1 Tax=Streptomyces pilosus TaxID=28893 RepID=UPI003630E6DF